MEQSNILFENKDHLRIWFKPYVPVFFAPYQDRNIILWFLFSVQKRLSTTQDGNTKTPVQAPTFISTSKSMISTILQPIQHRQ